MSLSLSSQNFIASWHRTDTILNSADYISDVLQMPDSGYILAGYTKTAAKPYEDYFLMRTNKAGDTLWTRVWGSSASDGVYSIHHRPGGGFLAVGGNTNTFSFLDTSGIVVSSKTYPLFGLLDAVLLPDSGYLLTGSYMNNSIVSDLALMRVDKNGDSLWTKKYGTIRNDVGRAIIQTSDGNFLAAGEANFELFMDGSYIPQKAYVVKFDVNGDSLWTDTIPASLFWRSTVWDVIENSAGEYIVAGNALGSNGMLASYSFSGQLNWTQQYINPYTNSGSNSYNFFSLARQCNGGYLIAGYETRPSPSVFGGLVISTNITGDTIWKHAYDTTAASVVLHKIIPTSDNGFFCGGYAIGNGGNYDVDSYLLKLDGQGGTNNQSVISSSFTTFVNGFNIQFNDASGGASHWQWNFGDGTNSSLQNPTHAYASFGSYLVCLTVWNECDTAVFCDSVTIQPLSYETANAGKCLSVLYPQPAERWLLLNSSACSGITNVKLISVTGVSYRFKIDTSSSESIRIDLDNIPDGVYIVEGLFESGSVYRSRIIHAR